MTVNRQNVIDCLNRFDFRSLFIEELGWDNPTGNAFNINDKDVSFSLEPVAEKKGVVVLTCHSHNDDTVPSNTVRRKIESRVRKIHHEHIIIFIDLHQSLQIWQWVDRKPGQPAQYREHRFLTGQSFESLVQKLNEIEINIDDEEGLRLLDITRSLKDAFDKDKVTKRFYDRFKNQQRDFLEFIENIPLEKDKRWYSAVMLNRLMFIYFIQKKGFLNRDTNYLQAKLAESREKFGSDQYYTFYRHFLRRLFHEGLDRKEPRGKDLDDLLGEIPYLNGGLFDEHEIEKKYPDIDIKDEAFQNLFSFFDQYEWHLDDRPIAKGNEINPEVLGYIFEKYINQKEMGAYYTKEDITEYISKNTIIPFLFDQAKAKCKIAFEGERSVWDFLRDDPDRYFYAAVKKGIKNAGMNATREIKAATLSQIPENIAIGLDTSKPGLLDRRKDWNTRTPEEFALPTEIWRETIARWQRYFEVREKIEKGEIRSINDFITYNLNIRQFAQDVIEAWEGPELIRAFYKAITKITVLDPTVGSGAFLFAALNILEPLYEACIIRMEQFVEELPENAPQSKFSDFKKVLSEINHHPSRKYFIYKSIIINNLYGVDIMDEAVEICKLRLFLKLVAEVDSTQAIEPLPDIDFNIRAGNTLVGFSNSEDVKKAFIGRKTIDAFSGDPYLEIKEKAEDVQALYDVFLLAQAEEDESVAEFKAELRKKLDALNDTLNHALAGEYGIDVKNKKQYDKWVKSHQPFHWWVEFYGIIRKGGFDVIIGNPPYVEYSKVKKEYTILNYKTEKCGNLYAFCIERALQLLLKNGFHSMIVPISMVSTKRMKDLRDKISIGSELYISSFSDRPSCLFNGVHQMLSIYVLRNNPSVNIIYNAGFLHWVSEERDKLFPLLYYIKSDMFQKLGEKLEIQIWNKIYRKIELINYFKNFGFLITICGGTGGYWLRGFTVKQNSDKYKIFYVNKELQQQNISAIFNSTSFYWFWRKISNCRDVIIGDISQFGLTDDLLQSKELSLLGSAQQEALINTIEIREGKMTYDQYRPSKTKKQIDEIDKVLAKHYGFTEEELDFIINYDIKYRMGKELDN